MKTWNTFEFQVKKNGKWDKIEVIEETKHET